jgi:hypothetical protein
MFISLYFELRPSLNGLFVDHLEQQGAEVVLLGMIDFVGYCAMDEISYHRLFRKSLPKMLTSKFALWYIGTLLEPIRKMFKGLKYLHFFFFSVIYIRLCSLKAIPPILHCRRVSDTGGTALLTSDGVGRRMAACSRDGRDDHSSGLSKHPRSTAMGLSSKSYHWKRFHQNAQGKV